MTLSGTDLDPVALGVSGSRVLRVRHVTLTLLDAPLANCYLAAGHRERGSTSTPALWGINAPSSEDVGGTVVLEAAFPLDISLSELEIVVTGIADNGARVHVVVNADDVSDIVEDLSYETKGVKPVTMTIGGP